MRFITRRRTACALALALLAILPWPLLTANANATVVDDDPFLYENMVYIYDAMMGEEDAFLAQSDAFVRRAESLYVLASTLQQHAYKDAAIWAVYTYGLWRLTTGDFDVAREQFQSVSSFRDAGAFLHYLDGRTFEEAGDFENAIGAYKSAAERLAIARKSFERLATPDTLRKLLEDHIADKTYGEAIQLIEAYAVELQSEPDVEKYAMYAKAMVELNANRLDEAETLFASLSGFMDADAMYLDVGAYKLQQQNDLQGAVEQYLAAQATAKADSVKDSDRLYFADTELIECQKALYAMAESWYETGDRENQPELLQQAKSMFAFLRDYENSAAMAALTQSRIDMPRHVIGDGVIDRETRNSLRFSFSDTASGPYLVRYYPTEYGHPIIELEIPTPSVTLDNLFPDMSYTLEVVGKNGESNTLAVVGRTLAPFADTTFRWDEGNPFVRLFSYQIADETSKSWAQIAQGAPSETVVRLPANGNPSLSGVGYGIKYSYIPRKDNGRQYPFSIQTLAILTVPGVGAISEFYQTDIATDNSVSVAIHLSNLLEALFAENPNSLARASQAAITIYVDGLYAFTHQLTLTHE